jgi:hypothetical protein
LTPFERYVASGATQTTNSSECARREILSTIHMAKQSTDSPSAIRAAAENADAAWRRDELAFAWRRAQDDAAGAYRAWCETPGVAAYAAYRAAQDRADQAQDVLAANVLAR